MTRARLALAYCRANATDPAGLYKVVEKEWHKLLVTAAEALGEHGPHSWEYALAADYAAAGGMALAVLLRTMLWEDATGVQYGPQPTN